MFVNNMEELSSKASKVCGVTMFAFEDALKVIDFCEKQGKKIYGIDSFIYKDQKVQPFLEHSVDFSGRCCCLKKDVYTEAREFLIRKQQYGFVFEIIYED